MKDLIKLGFGLGLGWTVGKCIGTNLMNNLSESTQRYYIRRAREGSRTFRTACDFVGWDWAEKDKEEQPKMRVGFSI